MTIVSVSIWGIVLVLAVFAATGVVLLVKGMRAAMLGVGEELTLRQRMDRYIGPVKPGTSLLNAPLRVALEFVGGSCGFPGLGWFVSGRMWVGLVMMVVGPALVWGFVPVALAYSGLLLRSPYAPTFYLPFVGVASAAALAVDQWAVRKVTR